MFPSNQGPAGEPFLPRCIFFLSPKKCKKYCFHKNCEIVEIDWVYIAFKKENPEVDNIAFHIAVKAKTGLYFIQILI